MPTEARHSWEALSEILTTNEPAEVQSFLAGLGTAEMARAISRLSDEDKQRLLVLLDPADAADVLEDVAGAQAAGLIENLPPEHAAAILDEVQSDRQADLLSELGPESAEAILEQMSPKEAEDVRRRLGYADDTAGGIMITEFLAYRAGRKIKDVLDDLQRHRRDYADYSVQYLFVVDEHKQLVGVLRMRDLVFAPHTSDLADVMIRSPLSVTVDTPLDQLAQFFDQHRLFGVPVVDDGNRLLGIVRRAAVEAANADRAHRQFLGLSGIIGGEEFRTMPLMQRCGRRLSWLSANIVLNIIAASVIAIYQETLAAAIALAVFLPMISDMSGCSGNQAVAVSMRELALGLVRPNEVGRVLVKEASLGLFNGLALGLLLAGVAFFWKGNPYLGLIVGSALAANTLLAASIGGLLPLLFKRLGLDPALVSGPILTTVTDMCGFFFVLSFATVMLPKIAGA